MSLSEADRTTLGCRKLRLYGYTIILDRKRAVVVLSRFSCVDVWEFYGDPCEQATRRPSVAIWNCPTRHTQRVLRKILTVSSSSTLLVIPSREFGIGRMEGVQQRGT
jgi:hypothetical protein